MPTTPDAVKAIISLAEVKEYLKVTSSNDDAIISALINGVSEWISGYLKRDLVAQDYRYEYYSGDGTRELILKNRPVNSIASLNIDALRVWGTDTAIDVSANLIIKKGSGIVRAFNLLYGFTSGDANIRVGYNAGYTAGTDSGSGTMPYEIRMAAKRLIDVHYRLGYSQRKLDNSSESQTGINTTFKDFDLPKDVKSMLEGWARIIPAPQFEYAD